MRDSAASAAAVFSRFGAQLCELLLIGRVGPEVGLAVSVGVGEEASRRSEPVTNLPVAGKPLLQV